MDLPDAMAIVVALAKSAMAEKDEEPEAHAQHQEAINIVEDFAVNELGDE